MNNSSKIGIIKLSNVIYFIIPFSCVLLQYNAPIMTYGTLILLAIAGYYLVKYKNIQIDKDLCVIAIVLSLQLLVSELYFKFGLSHQIKLILNIWVICVITSLGRWFNNKEKLYKMYRIVCLISTFLVVGQYIYFLRYGQVPDPIKILPVNSEDLQNWVVNAIRPSGWFSEPASYAVYMIPFIIMALFWKGDIRDAGIITVGVLLSGSSSGIIVLSIIWIAAIIKADYSKNYKVLLILLVIFLGGMFQQSVLFEIGSSKIRDIINGFSNYRNLIFKSDYSYSNYLRLIKGWVTLAESPLSVKLIGIGQGNLINLIQKYGIYYSWSSRWAVTTGGAAYYSSAAGIFLESGLLCGTLYYFFVLKKCKTNFVGLCIMMSLLILGLSGSTFFNSTALYYFMMYYFFSDDHRKISFVFN